MLVSKYGNCVGGKKEAEAESRLVTLPVTSAK